MTDTTQLRRQLTDAHTETLAALQDLDDTAAALTATQQQLDAANRGLTTAADLLIERDARIAQLVAELEACRTGGTPAPAPPPPAPAPAPAPPALAMTGAYKGGLPAAFTADGNPLADFEDKVGGPVGAIEWFSWISWARLEDLGGTKTVDGAIKWLKADPRRRAIVTPGLYPQFGPDGTWGSRNGSNSEVRTALRRGALGDFDRHWEAHADLLAAHPELATAYDRIAHEPNGDFWPWCAAPDPGAFTASWRRFASIIRDRCPQVRRVWNVALGDYQPYLRGDGGQRMGDIELAFPGPDHVDVIAVDLFPPPGNTTAVPKALAWLRMMADKHDRPTAIMEWGVKNSENVPLIEAVGEFVSDPENRCELHVPWCETTASDGDHDLDHFPASLEAFKAQDWVTL